MLHNAMMEKENLNAQLLTIRLKATRWFYVQNVENNLKEKPEDMDTSSILDGSNLPFSFGVTKVADHEKQIQFPTI